MKTFVLFATSLLGATTATAQHAKVAPAKPVSAPAAAERPSVGAKPTVPKPGTAHTLATKPEPRVTNLKTEALRPRPIRHWSPYWQNYCSVHPYAAVCNDPSVTARQTEPVPAAPMVIVNPFAITSQPGNPANKIVSDAVLSAPAKPIVKVPDELADTITVGVSQEDVRQKLGSPHSSISGGPDRYTYFLQSGVSLKLDFENGHVTQMRKVAN